SIWWPDRNHPSFSPWPAPTCSFLLNAASRGTGFVAAGRQYRIEFEQVTRLALECRADGLECREADGAGLSCFENRQIGERDSDSLGQLRQRHPAFVEHVVQ